MVALFIFFLLNKFIFLKIPQVIATLFHFIIWHTLCLFILVNHLS